MSELSKRERNELLKLRSMPWQNRTPEEYKRLLELSRKERPFNAMPKRGKSSSLPAPLSGGRMGGMDEKPFNAI